MIRAALLGVALLTACKGGDDKRTPTTGSSTGSGSATVPVTPDPMPPSWAKVLGDKPATFGPTMAALRLGAPVDEATLPDVPATTWGVFGDPMGRTIRLAPDGVEPKVRVDLEIRGGNLFAINVELYTSRGSIPEDSCAAFVTALEAKWGASPDRVWLDRDNHVRMSFRDTCRLRFERYADAVMWIGPEPTSVVPVGLVGKSPKELAPRVGLDIALEAGVTLRAEGIGEHASGSTTIDVYTKQGTISGLGAEAPASAADKVAIRERISIAFKAAPTRDAKTGYHVWATKPPIRMLETPSGVRIEVGDLTP